MFHPASRFYAACAIALLAAWASPARAGIIYESAAYTGADPGDYIVQAGRLIGARFSVAAATQVTSIGAGFGRGGSGAIFAAIVPLASMTAYPSVPPSGLAAISLADTVFAAPASVSDLAVPLSVTLLPGAYAVVFGSGLFGASGDAGLSDGNAAIGAPSFFQTLFSPAWQPQPADGIRVVVSSAIPEPASLALLGVGMALMAPARRKTRVGRATAIGGSDRIARPGPPSNPGAS